MSQHLNARGAHVAAALRNNEKHVDATALLHDLQHGSKGPFAVSRALQGTIPGKSTTKHITLNANTAVNVSTLAQLINLLLSVCGLTTLSISNFNFIPAPDSAEATKHLEVLSKSTGSSLLQILSLTNLAVQKDAEAQFEELMLILVSKSEILNLKGIAYDTCDSGESRFFKGLTTAKAASNIKRVQYVPNLFLNNLILANAYGQSDKQKVSDVYSQFIHWTLPAFLIFLLFASEGLESITLYIDLLYIDSPQIKACIEEFRTYLLLCSSLQEVKLLFHGDKVDSQLTLSPSMGSVVSVMSKAFDCLGMYAEYKNDLIEPVLRLKEVFLKKEAGESKKQLFFTNLCSKAFLKLKVSDSTIWALEKRASGAHDDITVVYREYCKALRTIPGAFDLFIKLLKELTTLGDDSAAFSGRTYNNLLQLAMLAASEKGKNPSMSENVNDSATVASSIVNVKSTPQRVDSARRRLGSPNIFPISALTVVSPTVLSPQIEQGTTDTAERTLKRPISGLSKTEKIDGRKSVGSSVAHPEKPLRGRTAESSSTSGHTKQNIEDSRTYASYGPMTKSALCRSDLQTSHATHALKANASMHLSSDHTAINTSGPISIADLLTRNSNANNHLRAELHSMLLELLPETPTVKDIGRRIEAQEDMLIELRNCVLFLVQKIGPNALSQEDASYIDSVLRGSKIDGK